jgi:L-ascorbate metabolism protein UlaG (beta-lactamase superfamily)
VTPLGNSAVARAAGIRRVEELDWWQDVQLAAMSISATPAYHFSARGPFDKNRSLWGGFVITLPASSPKRVYFAGDSAYGPHFADIGRRLGPIDLALVPIGAYEPRWFMSVVHMNPAEAMQAHLDLQAVESVAMHYGTFQLTTEGIDDPIDALAQARRERNVPESQFRAIGFGASVRL